MTGAEILDLWLRGTTCHRDAVKRSILFENATHIVLKHNSHSEYCGRMTGSKNCESYAKLYAKSEFESGRYRAFWHETYLKKWEGRISKKRILEDCKGMFIYF